MSDMTIRQSFMGPFPRNSVFARWNRGLWKWAMNLALLLAVAAVMSALLNLRYNATQKITTTGRTPLEYSFEVGMVDSVSGYLTTDNLESNINEKLPTGVTAGPLEVAVPLKNPGWREQIYVRASVPKVLLILFVVWMLRQIVWTTLGDDASEGNPFVRPNVRRLRWIAGAIVLMPFAQGWADIAQSNLVWMAMEEFLWLGTFYMPQASYMPFGVALLVFALAEVFAAGIRLREDVEGLV
jgi:hypothetical protein